MAVACKNSIRESTGKGKEVLAAGVCQMQDGREEVRKIMVREKMIEMMDILLHVAKKISEKEDAKPEEIAILPALSKALVEITAYAVIEKKD